MSGSTLFRTALLLGACASAFTAEALAAEPRHTVIFIATQDSDAQGRKTVLALRSQLVDLGVNFEVEWAKSLEPDLERQSRFARKLALDKSAMVVAWCDFAYPDLVLLYLLEPGAREPTLRQVDPQVEGSQGVYEAIAAIVRSRVDTLLIDAPPPRARAERATQPGAPEAGDEASLLDALRGQIGLGYSGRGYSDEALLAHQVNLQLALHLSPSWSVLASYGYAPDVVAERGGARLQVSAHQALLGGAYRYAFKPMEFSAQLGLALRMAHRATSVSTANMEALPPQWDPLVAVEGRLAVGFKPLEWLTLSSGPGVAVLVRNIEYQISINDAMYNIISPWPVQPFWAFDLLLDFG